VAMLQNLNKAATRNVRDIGPIVLALALVLPLASLAGCANKAQIVKVDAGIYTVLGSVQDVEMALHTSSPPVIGDDLHGQFNQRLAGVLRLGKRFNDVVRDWPAGTPKPAEVGRVAIEIATGLQDLLKMLPDSPTVTTLRLYLQSALGLITPFIAGA
jgi:hypothetical protein